MIDPLPVYFYQKVISILNNLKTGVFLSCTVYRKVKFLPHREHSRCPL